MPPDQKITDDVHAASCLCQLAAFCLKAALPNTLALGADPATAAFCHQAWTFEHLHQAMCQLTAISLRAALPGTLAF